MDEAELSRWFPTGDEACLEGAVARYGQALLRYCHHILCDYHEAQDAVQTALLPARKLARTTPTISGRSCGRRWAASPPRSGAWCSAG